MAVPPNTKCALSAVSSDNPAEFLHWWSGNGTSLKTAQPIFTGASVRSNIDVTLVPSATVTGTVTGEFFGAQVGLPNVAVSLWKQTTNGTWGIAEVEKIHAVSSTSMSAANGSTDSSGTFSIGRLPAGVYILRVDPQYAPGRWADQWLGGKDVFSAKKFTVTAGSTTQANTVVFTSGAETVHTAEDSEIFRLVNAARATGRMCGTTFYPATTPLMRDSRLDVAARRHAQDMAENNYVEHTDLNGAGPSMRGELAGWISGAGSGENIAAGQPTVSEVMTAWLGSPGHCANIMYPMHTHFGTGKAVRPAGGKSEYSQFWVQNFSNPNFHQATVKAPSAPLFVKATAVEKGAFVSFGAAGANNSVVTNYTITASPGGLTCTTAGELGCGIMGLTVGSSYTFTVRATNNAGVSPTSVSSNSVTVLPQITKPPGVPQSFYVETSSGAAVGTWKPPTVTGGGAITSYIFSATASGQLARNCTTITTSCTLKGLLNGTNYTFTVRATNSAGAGVAAQTIKLVADVPDAPAGIKIIKFPRWGEVTVAGIAPVNNGGSPVQSYLIWVEQGGAGKIDVCEMQAGASCTLTGLAPGETYVLRAIAYNTVGGGAVATSTMRQASVSGRVVNFRVAAWPCGGCADTRWTVGPQGGSGVTGYRVAVSGPNNSSYGPWKNTVAPARRLTGLIRGKTYKVLVVAENTQGSSLEARFSLTAR